jgi:hypothetical protein
MRVLLILERRKTPRGPHHMAPAMQTCPCNATAGYVRCSIQRTFCRRIRNRAILTSCDDHGRVGCSQGHGASPSPPAPSAPPDFPTTSRQGLYGVERTRLALSFSATISMSSASGLHSAFHRGVRQRGPHDAIHSPLRHVRQLALQCRLSTLPVLALRVPWCNRDGHRQRIYFLPSSTMSLTGATLRETAPPKAVWLTLPHAVLVPHKIRSFAFRLVGAATAVRRESGAARRPSALTALIHRAGQLVTTQELMTSTTCPWGGCAGWIRGAAGRYGRTCYGRQKHAVAGHRASIAAAYVDCS